MLLGTLCPGSQLVIREIKNPFTPYSKCEFAAGDQVFPLIFIYCLLLLPENKLFQASFIHKNNCSAQFLSAYFLLWEILNLNLTFAINVTLNV